MLNYHRISELVVPANQLGVKTSGSILTRASAIASPSDSSTAEPAWWSGCLGWSQLLWTVVKAPNIVDCTLFCRSLQNQMLPSQWGPHSNRLQFLSSARLPLGVRLYGGLVWPLTKPRAKNKKTMTSKGNSPRPTEQSVLTLLSFTMAAKQGICQVFQNSFQYISLCARSNSRC